MIIFMNKYAAQMLLELMLALTLVSFLIIALADYQIHALAKTQLNTQKLFALNAMGNLLEGLVAAPTAEIREQQYQRWQNQYQALLKDFQYQYQCHPNDCQAELNGKTFQFQLSRAF